MAGEWKRGHAARGRGGFVAGPVPLGAPGLEAPDDLEGLDSMDPEDYPSPEAYQASIGGHAGPDGSADYMPGDMPPAPGPAAPAEPLPADPPAGRVPRGGRAKRARASSSAPRITAAVRSDIEGKLGLMLQIGGTAWAARDPVCGGAFLGQLPAIRPAAVDLVLMSPDLVVWFTGVGGGFMLWFNLIAACWPVAGTVWAHHGPGAGRDSEQDPAAAGAEAYAA